MNEEILRPVNGDAPTLLAQARQWQADVKNHMSANELRILHHLERYRFAAEIINESPASEKTVLDIGAGDGTGLSVICDYCEPQPRVHAIELDAEACQRMQRRLPQVETFNLSIDDFEFSFEYDFTLLFETLGHQYIVSDLELLKKLNTRTLLLSIPYYRHYEKKFYFYRLYDPISIRELLEHAMPEHDVSIYGQFHPFNREHESDCAIVDIADLKRDPDFIICKAQRR